MPERMTYGQACQYGIALLKDAGIIDAETDAFYLMAHVTGMSKAEYLLNIHEIMPPEKTEGYRECLERRAQHEPCQYIIGSTEFMGLSFRVTPDVLVPRQDTETLAEAAIASINNAKQGESCAFAVLDLCTGSGALAVSVKYYCPEAEIYASDISSRALQIAEENAENNGVKICFKCGDLFDVFDRERFDMIISNPPYVTEEEYQTLMPEVRDFEPSHALLAGEDGLDFYRRIAKKAVCFLKPEGELLLEIGCGQGAAVSELLEENGYFNIRVLKDLNGLDRVVAAKNREFRDTELTELIEPT